MTQTRRIDSLSRKVDQMRVSSKNLILLRYTCPHDTQFDCLDEAKWMRTAAEKGASSLTMTLSVSLRLSISTLTTLYLLFRSGTVLRHSLDTLMRSRT